MLLCDLERLGSAWHPDDVATWTHSIWAANLGLSDRRLTLDLQELRALALIDPDTVCLTFCRPAETETAAHAPRPRYPSDLRRTEARQQSRREPQRALAEIPQAWLAESEPSVVADAASRAEVASPFSTNSALAIDEAPPRLPMDSAAPPLTRATGPVPVQNLYPNRTGPVPVPEQHLYPKRTGPVPESTQDASPSGRVSGTVVETFIELGMTRLKAVDRFREFGEERCRQALQALAASNRPIKTPSGYIVDFLINKRCCGASLPDATLPSPQLVSSGSSTGADRRPTGQDLRRIGHFLRGAGSPPGDCPSPTFLAELRARVGDGCPDTAPPKRRPSVRA